MTWAPTAWTCPSPTGSWPSPGVRPRQFLATQRVDGSAFRVLTAPTRGDAAVQVARPLDEIEATLAALRRRLLLFGLLGVGLAAGLGTVVARGAVRPVDRLTEVAEEVAATQDLSRRIDVGRRRRDRHASRDASTPCSTALEQARTAQEQLVADASHELRTPLTSLRTNIEVLARGERLDPAAQRALIDDVVLQLDEFGRLVDRLVELARGDRPATRSPRSDSTSWSSGSSPGPAPWGRRGARSSWTPGPPPCASRRTGSSARWPTSSTTR